MEKMTRRSMLWATSTGVAALGGVAAFVSGMQRNEKADAAASTMAATAATGNSLTLFVSDVTKNEIHLMTGEREVVIQNSAIVRQLLSMAK
jgi:hypothetical protein